MGLRQGRPCIDHVILWDAEFREWVSLPIVAGNQSRSSHRHEESG